MIEAAEIALELEKVCRALEHARIYVAGHDQAAAARDLAPKPRHSALRTALEQAEASTERIVGWLRERAESVDPDTPSPWRDGGPM